MQKIYDINGTVIQDDVSSDALTITAKTLDSYGLERIAKLEELHPEYRLPELRLYGDTSKMTKDKAVNLTAKFTNGARTFECIANTKWQGENSLKYEKKNYNIKLRDSQKNKYTVSFKDWFPTHKFHVKANYTEPSLVRNSVGSKLGRMAYPCLYPNNAKGVIDSFPIILYINDEWWGCYTWNTTQDGDLFAMDEGDKNHMVFRCNAVKDTAGWDISVFEDRLRDDSTAYSLECLQRMINWTKNCTLQEFHDDVEDYFNLESLINYWLVVDIECATDSINNNTTWASWDGTHWYVTWYDTDLIFGMGSYLAFSPTLDLIEATKTTEFAYKYNPIWDKLYQSYYAELCTRYAELRQSIFTDTQTIIEYFTDYRNKWGANNLSLEEAKWPARTPSKAIELCGNDISERLAYCDTKYGYTP